MKLQTFQWVIIKCLIIIIILFITGSINFDGLNVDWDENFSLPKDYLLEDVDETMKYLQEQVGKDLPAVIQNELNNQRERIQSQL